MNTGILPLFKNKRIAIVGDVMIDRYLNGAVQRISPEAPVPVVMHRDTEDRLGGAANVALNVLALGGVPVLLSVVGDDAEGAVFQQLLANHGISDEGLIFSNGRVTTIKTRVLGNRQQMLRIDRENTHDLNTSESDALNERLNWLIRKNAVDALIFQDYNKGVICSDTISYILNTCKEHRIITAVDPKKRNFLDFKNVTLFKPNLKEINDSAPFEVRAEINSLQQGSAWLREQTGHQITMITLSEKGIYLDAPTFGLEGAVYPTRPRSISDVSGAGDTVISVAALALSAGFALPDIACLSNMAGGQVCERPGVVPVDPDALEAEWDQYSG